VEAARSKAKVVVVGAQAVGKRSLVRRSAFDPFDGRYVSTFGANVSTKDIVLPVRLRDGTFIDLILWTVDSLDLIRRRTSFVRGAAGIFAVCDATRKTSLDELRGWTETVYGESGDVPIVLAVNKWDLADYRQVDASDAIEFVRGYDAEHFLTSAHTGENVEAAFQALGERIVMHRRIQLERGAPQGPP